MAKTRWYINSSVTAITLEHAQLLTQTRHDDVSRVHERNARTSRYFFISERILDPWIFRMELRNETRHTGDGYGGTLPEAQLSNWWSRAKDPRCRSRAGSRCRCCGYRDRRKSFPCSPSSSCIRRLPWSPRDCRSDTAWSLCRRLAVAAAAVAAFARSYAAVDTRVRKDDENFGQARRPLYLGRPT